MKQNDKTPYYSLNTEHMDKKSQAIKSHVADNRLDEETIVKIEYNVPFSHMIFFDNSDFHYGGQGYEDARANLALDIESKFFNAVMGIGGDFFDNANMVSATNVYGMRLSPADAMDGAKKMLDKYKDNLAYVLGGNHGAVWGNRNKITNIGPEEELARALEVPYARYSLAMTLNILSPDSAKVKKMNVCLKHEVNNPQTYINYLLKQGIVPDVIIREHMHNGNDGIYTTEVPVYDKNGILKGYENHQILVMTGKSMQNGNTYYGGQKMFDLSTNVKGLMLSWAKNPYYSSDDISQPKYTPQVVPFNVLHRKENKIGTYCQMLLNHYARPNIEQLKDNLKDKSISQITEQLETINNRSMQQLYEYIVKKKSQTNTNDKESEEYVK